MSKQEIKDEYKNVEGDPLIKRKLKKNKTNGNEQNDAELPTADVVITNPTHFAVALKYSQGMTAPKVIAKGQDYVALKIREAAKENKIIFMKKNN
jgi:flagellar biosynthetic protein FlhB